MRRPLRTESVEVTLSFRLHDCAGVCCYVTALRVDTAGQSSVLDSRHFTNEPLALIDSAEAYARQLVLEHFLPGTEPF
jgi:hypothetical protein